MAATRAAMTERPNVGPSDNSISSRLCLLAGPDLDDAERVGEARLGGAGAQGLLLAGVGRPAGEPDELECGAQPPVRIGEALAIDLGRTR